MPYNLKVDTEAKQPIAVKEYDNDQKAKHLEEMSGIPENEALLGAKVPFDKRTDAVIDREPKAKPQIGPFPGVGYIVY
jgi:hypothetical protein